MSSDEKLDEILRRIGLMETGIENLGKRLEAVEYDLSSNEGAMAKGFNLVEERFNSLNGRINGLESQVSALQSEMQNNFRGVERRLDVVSADINKVRADLYYMDERIRRLERDEPRDFLPMTDLPPEKSRP